MTTITTIDSSKFIRPKTTERWRGRFGEWTQNIGNDEPEMRTLAARMLAIESQRPCSFSLRAVSVMGDVDTAVWKSFEGYVANEIVMDIQYLIEIGLVLPMIGRLTPPGKRLTRAGRELELLTATFKPKGIDDDRT